MKYIITEPQFDRMVVGNLIPAPKYVVQELNRLKEWIYYSSGLGLEDVINDLLDPLKSNISEDEINKYKEGINILFDNNKITKGRYDDFLKDLPSKKLVYDEDGNWHPVNKLCTNYTDLSVLLTDLLFRSYEKGGKAAQRILETIKDTRNLDEIKETLTLFKRRLPEELFEKYLESPEELLNYVGNSIKKTEKGEEMENKVKHKLLSLKPDSDFPKLLYQGGNGDFIDMEFSVDLIIQFDDDVVKTIQVKSNEGQVIKFVNNKRKSSAVDLVIWPGTDENNNDIYKVKVIKTGETKIIK
jgi:hypothetical protein